MSKRRLESRQFLERYKKILKEDGVIEFKTDNNDLFEFILITTIYNSSTIIYMIRRERGRTIVPKIKS